MSQILIPNYTTKTSGLLSHYTALDSEGGKDNMTWGHHLKPLIDLEWKLLENCHPINISAIAYVEKKGTNNRVLFGIQLDTLTLCFLK